VPVVLAFGLYHGRAHYSLAFETYSEGLEVSRRNRAACLGALIRGYAERLEHYARLAPYNWFNFYDFWNAKHVEGNIHADLGADADAAVQRRTAVRRVA
jgi:predicted LPLAT superfamily acyltransferase